MDKEESADYWDDEESDLSSEPPLPAQQRDSRGRWTVQITRAPMKTVKPAPLKSLMGPLERKRKITLEDDETK